MFLNIPLKYPRLKHTFNVLVVQVVIIGLCSLSIYGGAEAGLGWPARKLMGPVGITFQKVSLQSLSLSILTSKTTVLEDNRMFVDLMEKRSYTPAKSSG